MLVLEVLPFVSRDVRLFEDSAQEFLANIALVRVRDPEPRGLANHVLVVPTGVRIVEAELPQVAVRSLRFTGPKAALGTLGVS
jgi:hypothetical protein